MGASVAANKIPGVRAGLCHDIYSAHQGVEHDDMNVLVLGARVIGVALAQDLARTFLSARFTGEDRHRRRLQKIKDFERRRFTTSKEAQTMTKMAIILQAGTETHEGLARALHALLYTKELLGHGHQVRLLFDGAGTEWVPELIKPDHKLHALFTEIQAKGDVSVVCDYCAEAFKVKSQLSGGSVPLVSEFLGHPSIAKYVEEGYQILTL